MSFPFIYLPSLGEILKDNPGWLDEAVDTAEASRTVGFPPCTLHTWRSRGDGPPFLKIGPRSCATSAAPSLNGSPNASGETRPTTEAIMAEKTKPVSIRLGPAKIEQLQARAYTLAASVTGIVRDLIRTGLVGGDNKALADRLMLIERRIVASEQQGREIHPKALSIDQAARDLLAMIDALLKAPTVEGAGRAA